MVTQNQKQINPFLRKKAKKEKGLTNIRKKCIINYHSAVIFSKESVMLDYTKTAINKTINDFKKISYYFTISMQLLYIAYLIYAIFAPTGITAINIILTAVSVAYLIFYLVTYDGENQKLKIFTKRAYKWFKLAVKAFTLGVMLYGIYATVNHVTPLSVILTALMVVAWTLQVILEIVLLFLENEKNFLLAAIEADIQQIMKPVHAVGSFFDKVRGKEPETPKEPTKSRKLLDRMVSEKRAEKKQLKEELKAERKAKLAEAFKSKFSRNKKNEDAIETEAVDITDKEKTVK